MTQKRQSPLDLLQETHEKMCEKVRAILDKDEPTVQELKLVKEFLKDNKIEALPIPGSSMGRVMEAAANNPNIIKLPTSFPGGDLLEADDPEVVGVG